MTQEGRLKILIVDDVPDNLDLMTGVLDGEPYEIITAGSAMKAVELLGEHRFALAILDVQMPGTDGYELCRIIREEHGLLELPVIFLTAERTSPDCAVRGLELGACDYVSKPFNAAELRSRIRVAVRNYQEHQHAVHATRVVTRRLLKS